MLPKHLKWEEAIVTSELKKHFESTLASLIAFRSDRTPCLLGTAFPVSVTDEGNAVFCTAAHVLEFGREKQAPVRKHHSSAIREFLPPESPLMIEPEKLRAIFVRDNKVEALCLRWVVLSKSQDIAFFEVYSPFGAVSFKEHFKVAQFDGKIQTPVAMIGYADMQVRSTLNTSDGSESFEVTRRLVMRRGRVTHVHRNGHVLCRGRCIETTIPVSPGISGSPVALYSGDGTEAIAVGVVSSSESSYESLHRTSKSGKSIVALLPVEESLESNVESRVIGFKLSDAKLLGLNGSKA